MWEYYFYSSRSASVAQRMFYFDLYSSTSIDIQETWYRDWQTFGYTYDLQSYKDWKIPTPSVIEAAPLVISQRYFMSFVDHAKSNWSLSNKSANALYRWCLGWQKWGYGQSDRWNFNFVGDYMKSKIYGIDTVRNIVKDLTDAEFKEINDLS